MEIHRTAGNAHIWTRALLVAATGILCGCVQQPSVPGYVNRATDPYAARRWSAPAFTPAHSTFADAAKHFLSIKPKPQQPIDFPHNIHTFDQIGIECQICHSGVRTSARAGIPSINICMSCHEDLGDPADPRIQRLRNLAKAGEDMPWQRVYGFLEESHVRFNHAPHIRANVECTMCHGDVTQMTVAQRTVDHTMGFCVDCHNRNGASKDCLTCHY